MYQYMIEERQKTSVRIPQIDQTKIEYIPQERDPKLDIILMFLGVFNQKAKENKIDQNRGNML